MEKMNCPTEVLEILRTHGARITPLVTTIINHLHQSAAVHSPQEIKLLLKEKMESEIGFPTIYRILERLVNAGVLHRMHRNDNQTCFFLCRNPGVSHHHHFICTSCSKVDEIDICPAGQIEEHISATLHATVTNHIIQLEGLCAECKDRD